jgi:hypothetical protein
MNTRNYVPSGSPSTPVSTTTLGRFARLCVAAPANFLDGGFNVGDRQVGVSKGLASHAERRLQSLRRRQRRENELLGIDLFSDGFHGVPPFLTYQVSREKRIARRGAWDC